MSHKILITGHTSGIGEIIYNGFENVHGVSRSEGYDISNVEQSNSIVSLAKEYDIFINNAFSVKDINNLTNPETMFSQTELLYKVYDVYKDSVTPKLIINLGSNTTHGIKSHIWPYSAAKQSLEKGSEQLCYHNSNCFVSLLTFGYVATDRVKNTAGDSPMLPIECVNTSINYIIDSFSQAIKVKEICLLP